MKKIFYILPEYHKDIAGHFRYNIELLEELAKTHKIFLFIEKGDLPDLKFVQKVVVGKFMFLPLRIVERKVRFLLARLAGYRVFYSHYGYLSALIACLICRFTFGKLYFWHCEMRGSYEKKDCVLCNIPDKLTKDWPFRLVLKLAKVLVTCTEKMKKYYHESFGVPLSKIRVIGNWVDVDSMSKAAKVEKTHAPTILFVHWLSPRKGSRILPELFEEVVKHVPDAKLLVAGEGPDFEWMQSQWKERKLEKHVDMLGAVPNHEIAKLYGKAHILLHPSREEEFGRVMIEAMACGTPIVATDTFGAQSVLSDKQKKWIFDYDSTKNGAALCVKLLGSQEKRKELAEDGLKHVREFDKDNAVRKFSAIFEL